jgi:hypothetical protein
MERFVMEQRRCTHCRSRFIPLRNHHQHYCSKLVCQKTRRCRYQKKKLNEDPDYKAAHRLSQKKWRYKHPDYWRCYRLQHQEYVAANRLAQANRDQKYKDVMKPGRDFGLANMYSLFHKNINISYCYKVFLGKKTALQICTL